MTGPSSGKSLRCFVDHLEHEGHCAVKPDLGNGFVVCLDDKKSNPVGHRRLPHGLPRLREALPCKAALRWRSRGSPPKWRETKPAEPERSRSPLGRSLIVFGHWWALSERAERQEGLCGPLELRNTLVILCMGTVLRSPCVACFVWSTTCIIINTVLSR